MVKTFSQIVEQQKEEELIPFLKTLGPEDKQKIAPVISQYIKYQRRIENTHAQYRILSIAAFICFNLKEYVRNQLGVSYMVYSFVSYHVSSEPHFIDSQLIDEIMEWYRPDWLTEFLNDPRKNNDFKIARYEELMRWHEKGYIQLTPELIASTLGKAYYRKFFRKGGGWLFDVYKKYTLEKLYQYPATLQEHIWYLFQYPSNIMNELYDLPKGDNWKRVFRELVEGGDINRHQLLKACLKTVNYDFKKAENKWFIELFTELKPTPKELLSLQEEMCIVIQQGEDKMLSVTLNNIKSICNDLEFQRERFVQPLSSLLSSSQKTTVNIVLDILLKIVGKHATDIQMISQEVYNVFLHKDEKLQKKAFCLLQMYGNKDVKNILVDYSETLHPGVRPVVEKYLGEIKQEIILTEKPEKILPIVPTRLIREDNRIPKIHSFEDFLYFAASLFTSGEPWRCFLLPEYLSCFAYQINAETLLQFEPIIKNADKVCWDQYGSITSGINTLYCLFLVEWIKQQIKKYPDASPSINRIIEKMDLYERTLSDFDSKHNLSEEVLDYFLLMHLIDLLNKEERFELLSTPTHTPIWIDPIELVCRIKRYQDRGVQPSTPDMQLAIMRCARDYTEDAILLAQRELKGELKELILFLFGKRKDVIENTDYPAWWLTASLTRDPFIVPSHLEKWGYSNVPESYLQNNYPWKIKEFKLFYGEVRRGIFFDLPHYEPPAINDEICVYTFAWARKCKITELFYTPYNHEKLLAQVIGRGRDFKTLDSHSKAFMLSALNGLIELYIPYTPMDYLLVVTSMLAPDREVRDLAAALWIKMAIEPTFDNQQFGRILAEITDFEWLPFKRFIDLLNLNFQNISALHNQQLIICIQVFLLTLKTPVKGVKPLLDSYYELLLATNVSISEELKEKLGNWKKEVPGLKKQIDRILAL